MALSSGVDVDLGGDAYMNIINAVNTGRISNAALDASVARVLRLKFEMGLFENPYVIPEKAWRKKCCNDAHIALARKDSASLNHSVENDRSLLPLNKNICQSSIDRP